MFYLIFLGVAVMKNKLFAIGGYNGSDRLDTVEVFDAETKRWSRVASMNGKRSAVGAVSVGKLKSKQTADYMKCKQTVNFTKINTQHFDTKM